MNRALANPFAWRARWIAPPLEARTGTNVYFRARTSFQLSAPTLPETFVVRICAESSYRVTVNGTHVGHGPARGTRAICFFDIHEVAPLLRSGDNWVGIEVHSPNQPTFRAAPVMPALIVQSDDGTLITDDSWEIASCPDWRQDVSLFTFQIGFMEWQDLRNEPAGWAIGVDAGAWTRASVVSDSERLGGKLLLPRDIPMLARSSREIVDIPVQAVVRANDIQTQNVAERMTLEPHYACTLHAEALNSLQQGHTITLSPPADAEAMVFVVDFGSSVNGSFELELSAPAGTIVDLGYEESLIDRRLHLTHYSYRFADRYILRSGKHVIGNRFTSRGFRFVQIVLRDSCGPVQVHRVQAFDELYPHTSAATFECSDDTLNQVWSRSVETMRQCSTDTLVDCPWRENTLYFNDMLVEALSSLQLFGTPDLIERCYRLAISQPSDTRLLPAAVPAGVILGMDHARSIDRITLASANLLLPGMLREFLLYTGNRTLVDDCRDVVAGILETVSTWEDAAGLITPPKRYWNMIDWSYPMESIDEVCTSTLNWMYVQALECTANLSHDLRWRIDEKALQEKANRVKNAIDARFWDHDTSAFVDWLDRSGKPGLISQLANACAVWCADLPQDRVDGAVSAIMDPRLLAPELFMHHFVLRALTKHGRVVDALGRVRKYWGDIVRAGATTIWEMGVQRYGKAAFDGAGSLCHGFATAPIDLLQSVILGVRPTKPGFAEFNLAPHVADLGFAKGTVPTPKGDIHVAWQRDGDHLQLHATIPEGTIARLLDGRHLQAGVHALTLALSAHTDLYHHGV